MHRLAEVLRDLPSRCEQVWEVAKAPFWDSLAMFGGIAGVASAVLSIEGLAEDVATLCSMVVSACIVAWILSLVAIAGYAVWRALKDESTQQVPFAHNAQLHVIAGNGYIENLARFVEHHDNYRSIVCVCGMNRKGSLEELTEGSVVRTMMEKIILDTCDLQHSDLRNLSSEELVRFPQMVYLQELINRDAQTLCGEVGCEFPYGTCLMVKYERDVVRQVVDEFLAKASPDDEIASMLREASAGGIRDPQKEADDPWAYLKTLKIPDLLYIIFLVNSRRNEGVSAVEQSAIVGPESASIITCVFDRVEEMHPDLLFIPALGTNRLANNHQSVIASIVQRYCSKTPPSRRLYDLAISVRKESMEWDGLNLVRLRRYIAESIRFYS